MSIQGKVNLDILRYANCWEDADILLQGLSLSPGKKILCIASGGDNALALLSASPQTVRAIDLSPVQLYVTELKQVAFSLFDHPTILVLLGVTDATSNDRMQLYHQLAPNLSPPARSFWDNHGSWFEKGIIHQGKFEKYFSFFRRYLLPFVHSRATVGKLFSTADIHEQERFYQTKWKSKRWQLLMNFFFSKRVMGRYGRDPEFLKHVKIPVGEYIRSKAEKHLTSTLPKENHFLDMIFNGNYRYRLPFYLRHENFESIKSNINKLSLSLESAEDAIQKEQFDCYALSNIFEYVSLESFNAFALKAALNIPVGGKLAYWNLMAPRSFAQAAPGFFKTDKDLSEKLSAQDKGFFYSRFLVEERI